jgi:hypothetical protein
MLRHETDKMSKTEIKDCPLLLQYRQSIEAQRLSAKCQKQTSRLWFAITEVAAI